MDIRFSFINSLLAPKAHFSLMTTATSFIAKELSENCLFNCSSGFYDTHLFEDQTNCLNAFEWKQKNRDGEEFLLSPKTASTNATICFRGTG